MVPKEPPYCDDRVQATHGLAAVACNRQEPLENESGHRTKDLLEGHIHNQGDVVPLPRWKNKARSTQPPRLMAGKALTFHHRHNATIDRNKWVKILEERNKMKEGEQKRCLCGKRRKWMKYEGRLL